MRLIYAIAIRNRKGFIFYDNEKQRKRKYNILFKKNNSIFSFFANGLFNNCKKLEKTRIKI